MSRVLVRKAEVVYDVMSGRPQLQVGVSARRDPDGRRMMPTFSPRLGPNEYRRGLPALQQALTDREGRIANIESQIPVDPRTGFRSAQDEKEFQHAMAQLGSGFESDQERFAFNPRDTGEGSRERFAQAMTNTRFGGRIGQGIGAATTGLVGVMSGLSALESGQGPLAAGLTGYTAAQQLSGLTPYLTEAGMRAGARFSHRRAPRTNTTYGVIQGLPTTAEPTMNNANTTAGSVSPTLGNWGMTLEGQSPVGVQSADPGKVGVQGTRESRRERRAPMATTPTTAETAGSTLASYFGDSPNEDAPAEGLEPPNPRPRTAITDAEEHKQSSTAASSVSPSAQQHADELADYLRRQGGSS